MSGIVFPLRSIAVAPPKTRKFTMYSSPILVFAGSSVFRFDGTATFSVPAAIDGWTQPIEASRSATTARMTRPMSPPAKLVGHHSEERPPILWCLRWLIEDRAEKLGNHRRCQQRRLAMVVEEGIDLDHIEPDDAPLGRDTLKQRPNLVVQQAIYRR